MNAPIKRRQHNKPLLLAASMPSRHFACGPNTSNPLFRCPHAFITRVSKCLHLKPLYCLTPCPRYTFPANTSNPLFHCPHAADTLLRQCPHLKSPSFRYVNISFAWHTCLSLHIRVFILFPICSFFSFFSVVVGESTTISDPLNELRRLAHRATHFTFFVGKHEMFAMKWVRSADRDVMVAAGGAPVAAAEWTSLKYPLPLYSLDNSFATRAYFSHRSSSRCGSF